jgi:hypothetical protein
LEARAPWAAAAGCLEEIEAAFPEWKLIDDEAMDVPRGAPGYVRRAEPRFYRLRRE